MTDPAKQPAAPKKGMPANPAPAASAPTPSLTRSQYLRGTVQAFLDFHKSWQDDDQAPNPPPLYWDLADSIMVAFADGDIPNDCRGLVEPVKFFQTEAIAFDTRSDHTNALPHDKFWVGVERLKEVMRGSQAPTKAPPLESMHELKNPTQEGIKPCSVQQIAKIWSCTTDEVARELANPGSVCTPEFLAAAEARRYVPTTKTTIRGTQPVVDRGEIMSLLEGETSVSDIIALTGATAEEVDRVRRTMRTMQPSG